MPWSTTTASVRSPTRPTGDGAILAIASGGPVPLGLAAKRALLAAVEAEPAARGIASTVLRDVYLAETVDEAVEKQRRHRGASFVTPEGVLIGPAVIHTAKEADARAREIRAELQVVAHDLSATVQRAQAEAASGSTRSAARSTSCGTRSTPPTPRSPRSPSGSPRLERDLSGAAQGRGAARPAPDRSRRDGRAVARERLPRSRPRRGEPLPELPPTPQQPISARVAVETLRRDRSALDDTRLVELRARAGRARGARPRRAARRPRSLPRRLGPPPSTRSGAQPRPPIWPRRGPQTAAAAAEREVAEREAAVNKAWRDASTELERLRERLRGRRSHPRRHRAAHPRGRAPDPGGAPGRPEELVAELGRRRLGRDAREALGARAAPARAARSREPARHRRVRGAAGAARLHGTRARRREEGAARSARGDRAGRSRDHRDLHHGVPRRRDAVRATGQGALPGRRGPARAHRSRRTAHERHRDRGEPGSQAREAHLACSPAASARSPRWRSSSRSSPRVPRPST